MYCMFTDRAKKTDFKKATIKEWEKAVQSSLKNASLKGLYTDTYEGIQLSPLYTQNQIDYERIDQYPGEGNFLRGFFPPGKKSGWRIAQKLKEDDWNKLKHQIKSSLQRGQDTVAFDPLRLEKLDDVSFKELNDFIALDQIPLLIFSDSRRFDIIAQNLLAENIKVSGAVAADIVSAELAEGFIVAPDCEQMEDWISQIKLLDLQFPHLRTVMVDTKPYKEAGAKVIQELGVSLALAVFYIEQMKKAGWTPAKTASKLIFRFSIGSDFFIELSKFRAFRVLWKTIADAYGLPEGKQAVPVSAETANLTKSVLDPYVNMLRAGNEAFAGILGGVDYLHVGSFDELSGHSTDFSKRIARNAQLLLKEESFLDRVIDPAGGSYFIEALTSNLVNEGWNFFQEIDKKEGIIEVLREGWLQGKIKENAADQLKDMETRKRSAVGVNVYAMGNEQVRYPKTGSTTRLDAEGKLKLDPLQHVRLAEKFERFRQRSSQLSLKGKTPTIRLICLGELKAYKPYADFVSGVLASAGIQAVWSDSFKDLKHIKRYMLESPEKDFCLCGPQSLYAEFAADIGCWVKESLPNVHLDIAGSITEEELASFQIDGTFYSGQNIVEKLNDILNRWEADLNG
ncbi:methylmalonyl-CoA mutase [Siminovitchia terrae]|uniref:Methylmalonyl-CoA mutase n=2 Tax=Siminovitchia terrae TaxID=1914933 RepID=A0ABQ4KWK0_SIMTE|nr:methylmalonyl-CoA mutase [Siminovitchia terrae]